MEKEKTRPSQPNDEILESFEEEGIRESETSHRREAERQEQLSLKLHNFQGN